MALKVLFTISDNKHLIKSHFEGKRWIINNCRLVDIGTCYVPAVPSF